MANILIVDDSRTSRKMLRNILEAEGHTIIGEGKNGEEGFLLFKELKPDLTTLDITMPVMDGMEALKLIHNEDPDSKVMMVTAAGQEKKMVECVKAGASEFVTKPYQVEEIVSIIQKLLS